MLKLKDLASRADFQVDSLAVSPARRLLEGAGGEAHLEPLIMQVLLLLLDGRGRVVTRDELFDQCWGGVMVGDDSLNQAVAKVRRNLEKTAPGMFEIETIPRTGYRLTVTESSALEPLDQKPSRASLQPAGRALRRRSLIVAGAAAAVVGGAGLLWVAPPTDPRFDVLMQHGETALRLDQPGGEKYFEQAVAIEPRNASAWGLLAYALGSGRDMGPSVVASPTALAAERAARAALEIDPNEPNALLTMTIVQSGTLDWFAREEEYRRILAIAPNNTLAMRWLRLLLHGVGRCNEALALAERALAIEPLCPDHQLRKGLQLWIHGRVPEADQTIDRAMELWPTHPLVRMARLMTYAFTGRPRAALSIVEEEERKPIFLSAAAAFVWRASLRALDAPTPSAIAAAREANIEGAKATPAIAAWGIVLLSALGELDAAFDLANGFLLARGALIVRPRADVRVPVVSNWAWRNTHGLFTPPTKAMRLDPRFKPLADGLGLTGYWRGRGIGPDPFLFRA
jgi:DNA-binding winged helix-turn-helix (wHTH) protein/tetratricopeptide (TPR) repeat protein